MAGAQHAGVGSVEEIDLLDNEVFRRGFPHQVFATLRREAPVFWHRVPEGWPATEGQGFWVLSKYEDIQETNRDSELFTAYHGPGLGFDPSLRGAMLVSMDGTPHTRLRKLINAGFTPRMVGRLEDQVRRWAGSILNEALRRGTCNFVHDVAYQLPMHMIADVVGVPVEDRKWLFDKAKDFLQCTDPDNPIPADQQQAIQLEMYEYGRKLGQEKRRNPQDDVWTILSTVEVDTDDGGRTALSELELDLFFLMLTVAGSETTRNAISLGLIALLDNPDQLALLRDEKGLMKAAVEEILRWSAPVSYFARRATRDTEIRGASIAAGDWVTLWYPSGNRDEEVFEDPFRFDVCRPSIPHVSFGGGGPHFCLGANLARIEIAVFFEELLARVGEIEILEEPTYSVQGITNPILVSLKELPVRLQGIAR